MQKGADPQLSPNQSGIRRSNRNRVPNPMYKQGIKELKRSLNKNGKPREDDSEGQEDERDSFEGSAKSDNAEWIRCSLQNSDGSHRDLLVAIKLNKPVQYNRKQSFAKSKPMKREVEKKLEDDIKKQRKKSIAPEVEQQPGQGMGLYQLLLNAAQKALAQDPQHQISEQMQEQQAESRQQFVRPKRQTKQQRQGKILGVKLIQNQLIFDHSKLKTIQVQMKPEPSKKMQIQLPTRLSNGMKISQIKKIFQSQKKNVYRPSILFT